MRQATEALPYYSQSVRAMRDCLHKYSLSNWSAILPLLLFDVHVAKSAYNVQQKLFRVMLRLPVGWSLNSHSLFPIVNQTLLIFFSESGKRIVQIGCLGNRMECPSVRGVQVNSHWDVLFVRNVLIVVIAMGVRMPPAGL